MYIVNVDQMDSQTIEKLYQCSKRVGEWLVYKKYISPFGKSANDKTWYFSKTEELDKALKEKPWWIR